MDNQNKTLENIANELQNITNEIKNLPRKFAKERLQFSFAHFFVVLILIALLIFIINMYR